MSTPRLLLSCQCPHICCLPTVTSSHPPVDSCLKQRHCAALEAVLVRDRVVERGLQGQQSMRLRVGQVLLPAGKAYGYCSQLRVGSCSAGIMLFY
jgi:hypothetical protein